MTVKELIENMLEYDMNNEVEVRLELNDDAEYYGFIVNDSSVANEVYLEVALKDKVLIDKDMLEGLEEIEMEYGELMSHQWVWLEKIFKWGGNYKWVDIIIQSMMLII